MSDATSTGLEAGSVTRFEVEPPLTDCGLFDGRIAGLAPSYLLDSARLGLGDWCLRHRNYRTTDSLDVNPRHGRGGFVTVKWDKKAIREIATGPEAIDAYLDIGWDISETAAVLAPKETGGGAASIHPEVFWINGKPEIRVSWEKSKFWMGFHELGTENLRARPFLRTAAARFQ